MIALEMNEIDKSKKIESKIDVTKNIKTEVRIRLNIEVTRGYMLNHGQLLEAFLDVKKLIDENSDVDFTFEEYIIDSNIADEYLYFNEFEKALPYIENSYNKALARGDVGYIAHGLIQLAIYNQHYGNYNKALDHAKEALQKAEEIEIPFTICLAQGVLARTYIFLKDYPTALRHTEQQRARTQENDYKSLEYTYSNSALIYAAMGDQKKATENIALYEKIKAKISDENMHHAVRNMEVKYKVQQKEIEIERHQTEIARHKARQIRFIAGLMALTLLLVLLAYIVRLRTRRNRALAERNDALTETNATKDKFFSIISHDLKNPAIAQRDAIQMLAENAPQWNAATLQNFYAKLLKSAEGQVELIYSLLNWAQVQTNRMPFNPIPFDLVSDLANDISIIRSMAERKGVSFHVETRFIASHNAPPLITGDSAMICTVVRNLLTNAVKFTPAGGEVTLSIVGADISTGSMHRLCVCPRIHDEHTDTSGEQIGDASGEHAGSPLRQKTRITVTDTGIGMTAEQIADVFRLDHKHSQCGTAGETGSGLGLIVCRELIEKHGSTLYIESEPAKGSRFWFEL
jgi:signal transduction histidine kinase